jgi:hypothetical protein
MRSDNKRRPNRQGEAHTPESVEQDRQLEAELPVVEPVLTPVGETPAAELSDLIMQPQEIIPEVDPELNSKPEPATIEPVIELNPESFSWDAPQKSRFSMPKINIGDYTWNIRRSLSNAAERLKDKMPSIRPRTYNLRKYIPSVDVSSMLDNLVANKPTVFETENLATISPVLRYASNNRKKAGIIAAMAVSGILVSYAAFSKPESSVPPPLITTSTTIDTMKNNLLEYKSTVNAEVPVLEIAPATSIEEVGLEEVLSNYTSKEIEAAGAKKGYEGILNLLFGDRFKDKKINKYKSAEEDALSTLLYGNKDAMIVPKGDARDKNADRIRDDLTKDTLMKKVAPYVKKDSPVATPETEATKITQSETLENVTATTAAHPMFILNNLDFTIVSTYNPSAYQSTLLEGTVGKTYTMREARSGALSAMVEHGCAVTGQKTLSNGNIRLSYDKEAVTAFATAYGGISEKYAKRLIRQEALSA